MWQMSPKNDNLPPSVTVQKRHLRISKVYFKSESLQLRLPKPKCPTGNDASDVKKPTNRLQIFMAFSTIALTAA